MDEFHATRQNFDPSQPDFAVDPRMSKVQLSSKHRNAINTAIRGLGDYHQKIPLQQIIDILTANNVIILQEDGTPWEGFVMPTGECGETDSAGKSKNCPFHFELAYKSDGNVKYLPCQNQLIMTACTMPSGKLEVICELTMKIKLSKAQWEQIGKIAGWSGEKFSYEQMLYEAEKLIKQVNALVSKNNISLFRAGKNPIYFVYFRDIKKAPMAQLEFEFGGNGYGTAPFNGSMRPSIIVRGGRKFSAGGSADEIAGKLNEIKELIGRE
jgi:hypothetical protein